MAEKLKIQNLQPGHIYTVNIVSYDENKQEVGKSKEVSIATSKR